LLSSACLIPLAYHPLLVPLSAKQGEGRVKARGGNQRQGRQL